MATKTEQLLEQLVGQNAQLLANQQADRAKLAELEAKLAQAQAAQNGATYAADGLLINGLDNQTESKTLGEPVELRRADRVVCWRRFNNDAGQPIKYHIMFNGTINSPATMCAIAGYSTKVNGKSDALEAIYLKLRIKYGGLDNVSVSESIARGEYVKVVRINAYQTGAYIDERNIMRFIHLALAAG